MLVGINGFKGAGKDTIGEYLVEQYDFTRASFAALLKESAAALFDIDPAKWEEWKNNPKVQVWIIEGLSPIKSLSAREFLQRYGTESHRDVFGYDFWVNSLLDTLDFPGRYVITDARFENELQAIRGMSGKNIQVIRHDTDFAVVGTHASEVRPNPELIDAFVYNDGTRDELYDFVDDVLLYLFGEKLEP